MPVNAPQFGTGAVDWGNYVGANQQTINRDRSQVQNYLSQQPNPNALVATSATVPQQTGVPLNSPNIAGPGTTTYTPGSGPGAFGGLPASWADNKPFSTNPGGSGYPTTNAGNNTMPSTGQSLGGAVGSASGTAPDWSVLNSALQTPTGFEQDLGTANYPGQVTAFGTLPANGPTANHPGAGNNWDAALEGQDAAGLAPTFAGASVPSVGSTLGAAAGANPGFGAAPVAKQTPQVNTVPQAPQAPVTQGVDQPQQSQSEFQKYLKGIGK
jgi:hypothetical protein